MSSGQVTQMILKSWLRGAELVRNLGTQKQMKDFTLGRRRLHLSFVYVWILLGPFMGSMWLLIVCAMSKFPRVFRMSKTESVNIIKCLKELFALKGNPV
uniref:Transmembrane protein n=1 Tax=Strongyloides stercoralis TaxID=6248 RepID=A0A0K0E5Z6_STRER